MTRVVIGIVDREATAHGTLMVRTAAIGGWRPQVEWVAPSVHLPADLGRLATVAAVAIPGSIRGANADDHFTQRLQSALVALVRQGVAVFAAVGSRRRSFIALHTPGVIPTDHRGGKAMLMLGSCELGSSGSAVRAASLVALLRSRRLRWSRSLNLSPSPRSTE